MYAVNILSVENEKNQINEILLKLKTNQHNILIIKWHYS